MSVVAEQNGSQPVSSDRAEAFGVWFRGRIEPLNMSQADVAHMLGVTRQTVGRWARGQFAPDPPMCLRIAQVMGVDPIEPLTAAGYMPPVTDDRQALIELVRYLPEEDIHAALQFIRFLVRQGGGQRSGR